MPTKKAKRQSRSACSRGQSEEALRGMRLKKPRNPGESVRYIRRLVAARLNQQRAARDGSGADGGAISRAGSTEARAQPQVIDHFQFEMTSKRPLHTERELLNQVREFGRLVGGRPFKYKEFNAWKGRRCSAATITHRFGTWRRALERAGIEGACAAEYEPDELIERLERAWRELGRPPGVQTIKRYGWVTAHPYKRHWGSLKRACVQLVRHKRGEISWEDLVRPRAREMRRALRPSMRWRVLERDGRACSVCGRNGRGVRLEVDHIVPVSAGGTDEMSNLRTLCGVCNRGRGDRVAARGARRKKRAA